MDRVFFIGAQELLLIHAEQITDRLGGERHVVCHSCGAISGAAKRHCGDCGVRLGPPTGSAEQDRRALDSNAPAWGEDTRPVGMLEVIGGIADKATPDGPRIANSFEVRLNIPDVYPEMLPTVREAEGAIERSWGHVNQDGTLCLEVPIEECRIFAEDPSLLGFVNGLVIPYLYGYCHWKTHGRHPFGEREHGAAGVVRHYLDELELNDEACVLAVLSYLFLHGYRGHLPCPCGSGVKTRKCHRKALLDYDERHTKRTLRLEFEAALGFCLSNDIRLSESLRKQVVRVLHQIKPAAGPAGRELAR